MSSNIVIFPPLIQLVFQINYEVLDAYQLTPYATQYPCMASYIIATTLFGFSFFRLKFKFMVLSL